MNSAWSISPKSFFHAKIQHNVESLFCIRFDLAFYQLAWWRYFVLCTRRGERFRKKNKVGREPHMDELAYQKFLVGNIFGRSMNDTNSKVDGDSEVHDANGGCASKNDQKVAFGLIKQSEHNSIIHGPTDVEMMVEEKFRKYFGYLARCEAKFLYMDPKN